MRTKIQNTPNHAFKVENSLRGTYKDLKRQAITLGMPFPDVVSGGIWGLISYIKKSTNYPDPSRIDEFDNWVDEHLDQLGLSKTDPLRHPHLRLGYIGEKDEEGNVIKRKRVPGIKKTKYKKPRTPKERDENNLVKGTKKSYTWELASKGIELKEAIGKVLEKFPEANEKSIRLWYRTCLKKKKNNENQKG